MRMLAAFAMGALLAPMAARAGIDFAPARHDFVCGRLARDVAAIDFNADGDLDLACVRFTVPGVVTLLSGDGHGNFKFFDEIPAGDGPTSILTADVNEDHIPDLVTGGFLDGPNGSLGVHLGDGQGHFTYQAVSFAPGIGPFHVNCADLNGDHHLDLVAGGSGDGQVRIFNGDGQGNFSPGLVLSGGSVPQHTAIGDVDGDRDPDLAIADNMGDVLIYRGDGAGNFGPAEPLDVGREPVWIEIRTYEDGKRPFIAVACRTEHTVEVYQWNPDVSAPQRVASLAAPLSPIALSFIEPTLFHDPDRPGSGVGDVVRRMPGIAAVSQTSSELRIWRTTDHAPLVLTTQDSPTAIQIADFNEDGLPDLAVPGFNTESVSLFTGGKTLGDSAPFTPVDSLPVSILPVAMDKDPATDFAILRRTARTLSVLLGRRGGAFESTSLDVQFPDVPTGFAAFDLEDDPADGFRPDFAVGRAVGSEIWIMGSNTQYARETIFAAGSGVTAIKSADLDLDGHDDLAATLFLTDNVSLHFGQGKGHGFLLGAPVSVGDGPYALEAGDLDANGLLDLVVANHDGRSFSTAMQRMPRAFTPSAPLPVQVGSPRGIAVGQLTDDSLPDVVVGGELGLEVFRGDGDGGFTSALFIPTAAEFETVRVADLDGDGADDVVAADRVGSAIVVFRGLQPTARDRGQAVGGDVLLAQPQLSFGVEFGPSDFALADINGDGAPDVAAISPLAGRLSVLMSQRLTPFPLQSGIADPLATAAAVAQVRLAPNPFTDATIFRLAGRAAGRSFVLRIFDAQGRLVATPFAGTLDREERAVRWDGRDRRGRAVPGGIYFYRLETGGVAAAAGKVVRF